MKKWLDKYNDDIPQAQNGIEGTMGGLTDKGFNYNGAWGGTMQMGGAMPGAVGFTYARVAGAAPANGPYAKKTKASAQNGAEMKYYQEGLDWKPRNISQDGKTLPLVDLSERGRGDMTSYYPELKQIKTKAATQLTKKEADQVAIQEAARRAIQNQPTVSAARADYRTDREKGRDLKVRQLEEIKEIQRNSPLVQTLSSFTPSGNNPEAGFIGAQSLGENIVAFPKAATNLTRFATGRNSYGDETFDKALGVAGDALTVGLGIGSTGLVKPMKVPNILKTSKSQSLATIPANASSKNNFFRKLLYNKTSEFTPFDRIKTGVSSYLGAVDFALNEKLLSYLGKMPKRTFEEIFPSSPSAKAQAKFESQLADKEGADFVQDWIYDRQGAVRPDVAEKINKIMLSKGSPFEKGFTPNFEEFYDIKNPLYTTSNKIVNTRFGEVMNNPELDELEKIRVLSNRSGAVGVNYSHSINNPVSYTFENMGPYEYPFSEKLSTAIHEGAHTMQKLGAFKLNSRNTGFGNIITQQVPEYKYYVPNTNTEVGRMFADVMKKPKKGRYTWEASPNELHSELMPARKKLVDKYVASGLNYEDAIQMVKNETDDQLDAMIKSQNLNRFFRKGVSQEAKRNILRILPGAVPAIGIGTAAALEQKREGGDIPVDSMGYWNPDNIGEPVIIPSNEITMEGVDQPLIGISDMGDIQYMEPGEDYTFDGEYVTEYPIAKSGVSVNNADAQPIEKLDQLLNFTNYNKPTKGGWLDKYQ